jgi:hypothetical protein
MLNYVAPFIRALARNCGKSAIARLATAVDYDAFDMRLAQTDNAVQLNSRPSSWLGEVVRSGICVIPNYWSLEQCAWARLEVDRIIDQYPKYLSPSAQSDKRVYGANRVSPAIETFNKDPELTAIASAYNQVATIAAFTLGARMQFSVGNSGSGEGWHRDAFFRQFKAILYLSDAGLDNGPFQLIRDSHRRASILHDMRVAGLSYMQNRLTDQNVAKLIDQDFDRLITLNGSAGTLILVDTSAVHRGMPIKIGTRYALTNYYFPEDMINQSMYEKFNVVPAQ